MNPLLNFNIDVVLNDLSRQTGKVLDARDEGGNRFEDFIPKEPEHDDFDRTPQAEEESPNRAPVKEETYEREPADGREYAKAESASGLQPNNAADSYKSSDAQAANAGEAKPTANQGVSQVDADVQKQPAKRPQHGSPASEQQGGTRQLNGQTNLVRAAAHLETLLQEGQTVSAAKSEFEPASAAVKSAGFKVQSPSALLSASSEMPQTAASADNVSKDAIAHKPALTDTVTASAVANATSSGSVQSQQHGLPVQAAPTAQLNVQNPIAEQAKLDPQSVAALASSSANGLNASSAATASPAEQLAVPAETAAKQNPIPTTQGRQDPTTDSLTGQNSAEEPTLKGDVKLQELLAGHTGQATGSNSRPSTAIKTQTQSATQATPSSNAAPQPDQAATTIRFTPVPQALAAAAELSSGETMMSRDFGQTSTSGIPDIAGRSAPLNHPTVAAARSAVPISNSAAVLNQIALQISKNVSNGTAKFEILMDPPELGRIEVRMELNNEGRLQAHLLADKQETLDLMQRDARQLEKALGDLGVDADSDSLEFSLREEDQAPGFTHRGGDEAQRDGIDNDKEIELLSLPPDIDVGATMETYGFKVREPIGISLNV